MPIVGELLRELKVGFDPKASESQGHILPITAEASVLTIKAWPMPAPY